MAFLDFLFGEKRSHEAVSVPLSQLTSDMFGNYITASNIVVTEEVALGVPAIWQAINLISGTLAHLPLHLYRTAKNGEKNKATSDALYTVLHDRPNGVHTKFSLFKWIATRLLLDGRAIVLVVKRANNKVAALHPLRLDKIKIRQGVTADGSLTRFYHLDGAEKPYPASEILDFVWMPKGDGVSHYSPIAINRETIAAIVAAERYATALFEGGGVPPLKLTGKFASPATQAKAEQQIAEAIKSAKNRNRAVLAIPDGFDLGAIGIDPVKQQLLELRQFQVADVSRIFNVPPALLYDLTHGTFSNVEQQNIAFAQHTMTPLIELIEQEMNAKLFGDRHTVNSVEFNLDGLLRGDFLSRMEGMARAVNSGLLTPNEGRSLDNRPAKEGGDDLLIQGATVRLASVGEAAPVGEPVNINT